MASINKLLKKKGLLFRLFALIAFGLCVLLFVAYTVWSLFANHRKTLPSSKWKEVSVTIYADSTLAPSSNVLKLQEKIQEELRQKTQAEDAIEMYNANSELSSDMTAKQQTSFNLLSILIALMALGMVYIQYLSKEDLKD